MADKWEFLNNWGSRWHWRRTLADGSQSLSAQTFPTEDACRQDAIACGYVEERRHRWSFGKAGNDWAWSVTRPDGSEIASPRGFPTLKDCIDAARSQGYVPWLKPDRRNRHREA